MLLESHNCMPVSLRAEIDWRTLMPGRSKACLCTEAAGIGQVSHARDAIVSFARIFAEGLTRFEWIMRGHEKSVEVVIDCFLDANKASPQSHMT